MLGASLQTYNPGAYHLKALLLPKQLASMRAVLSAINLPHVDKYKIHDLKRGRTRDTMKKERNLKEILVAADWRCVGTVAHQLVK